MLLPPRKNGLDSLFRGIRVSRRVLFSHVLFLAHSLSLSLSLSVSFSPNPLVYEIM